MTTLPSKSKSNHEPWVWRISPRKTVTQLGKFPLLAIFLSCRVVHLHAGAFLERAKGHGFCLLEMRHQCYKTNIFIVIVSHFKVSIFFLPLALLLLQLGFLYRRTENELITKLGGLSEREKPSEELVVDCASLVRLGALM